MKLLPGSIKSMLRYCSNKKVEINNLPRYQLLKEVSFCLSSPNHENYTGLLINDLAPLSMAVQAYPSIQST